MDKIVEMENILKDYESIQENIDTIGKEKERAELLLEKEEERYEEAKAEFGDIDIYNASEMYKKDILAEYESRIENYKNNVQGIDTVIKDNEQKREYIATDKNIQTITQGLSEIDKKIKENEYKIKRSEIELSEYYLKEDKEGKLPQDFYKEQDAIRNEIKKLTEKKEIFENFLDKLKISRDKLIENGKYLDANKEPEPKENPELKQESESKENSEPKQAPESKENPEPKQAPESKENPEPKQAPESKENPESKQAPESKQNPTPEKEPESKKEIHQFKQILSITCSVIDGKLVYNIKGIDKDGVDMTGTKSIKKPKKITSKEKRELKSKINTGTKNIDAEIYRLLKDERIFDKDVANTYLEQVDKISKGYGSSVNDIKMTYDFSNMRDAKIGFGNKSRLKRFANKLQKNNIAEYIKPIGRIKSLMAPKNQALLEQGSNEEKLEKESRHLIEQKDERPREDIIKSNYRQMYDEQGFDYESFCKDMNLTEEERNMLDAYRKTEEIKKNLSFKDRIKQGVKVGQPKVVSSNEKDNTVISKEAYTKDKDSEEQR